MSEGATSGGSHRPGTVTTVRPNPAFPLLASNTNRPNQTSLVAATVAETSLLWNEIHPSGR
jgi:hypothetical protein